jgi:3-deoxy-D-manno-octulosonic-acid transferase
MSHKTGRNTLILFQFIYNILTGLLYPFLLVASFFHSKLGASRNGQRDIWQKLDAFNNKRIPGKKVIWLHAASAGEFEQLQPLINRLFNRNYHLVQTVTSVTIFRKIKDDPRFDCLCYLPWDLSGRSRRFVQMLKPDIFINTRHDLWFNLLRACRLEKVPTVLVNANLYTASTRLRWWNRPFQRALFSQIDHLFTANEAIAALLKQLYFGEIHISGDTRLDRVWERAQANFRDFLPEKIRQSGREIIIYGSVVESDLNIVTEAIIQNETSKMLHIIVPHEIAENDLQPWEAVLTAAGVKNIRKNHLEEWNGESVIIWNAVGELADLYKEAQLAYVGAGFSTGVHNVTEPAVYGIPVAFGPKYDILAEAIEMADMQIATVIIEISDLMRFCRLLKDTNQYKTLCQQTKAYVDSRRGATDKIIEKLRL